MSALLAIVVAVVLFLELALGVLGIGLAFGVGCYFVAEKPAGQGR